MSEAELPEFPGNAGASGFGLNDRTAVAVVGLISLPILTEAHKADNESVRAVEAVKQQLAFRLAGEFYLSKPRTVHGRAAALLRASGQWIQIQCGSGREGSPHCENPRRKWQGIFGTNI